MLFRVERRITLFFLVCAQMNTRQLPINLFVYLFIYLFSVDCFMKFALAVTLQQADFWRQSHYSYPVYYFVFLFTGHWFLERSQTSECGIDSSKVRTSLVSFSFPGLANKNDLQTIPSVDVIGTKWQLPALSMILKTGPLL